MTKLAARLRSTLIWSVIAAAFIGPGTVTTAAKAGTQFGLSLLWTLLFSLAATFYLQEVAARLTIGSGRNLGQIIATRYRRGGGGYARLLFGAILLGCVAYQAGNLLGALSGILLVLPLGRIWLLVIGLLAFALLWMGNLPAIGRVLALVVAAMGITFLAAALQAETQTADWVSGLAPVITDESALLVIGLIGTTIVPYNLFLATGLSRGQTVAEMRWGLGASVIIGGIITLSILLTGFQLEAPFSFEALATRLGETVGNSGPWLLAIGLFAAGFTSATTAPLAAAVTGQTLFSDLSAEWQAGGWAYRATWIAVLLSGMAFGVLDIQPIPAIIAAQAVNGLILPLVAIFLLLAINDRRLLGRSTRNSPLQNAIGLLVVGITVFLGLHNLWLAADKVFPISVELPTRLYINAGLAMLLLAVISTQVFRPALTES